MKEIKIKIRIKIEDRENGGGEWESNPPGTLLSPTLVLKTRSATRPPHTSAAGRCAACRGQAQFVSGGLLHTDIVTDRNGYFNPYSRQFHPTKPETNPQWFDIG